MEAEGKSNLLANGLGDSSFSVQFKNHYLQPLLISAQIMTFLNIVYTVASYLFFF